MPSLKDAVAVATLVQALCIKIGQDWEAGDLEKPTPTWLIENNRWSAIKKGLDAEFILNISGETKPITSVIQDTVKILEPVCEELGSTKNLLSINSMLKKTKVVDEMRKISRDNSLIEVVHFLEEKLISSL